MIAEGTPPAPKVTVMDESDEQAQVRKSRFAQAKATRAPLAPAPLPRVSSVPRAYPSVVTGPYKPARGSLVLRAAGVDELLLNRVDRVRFYSLGGALLINGFLTGLLASYALVVLLPTTPGVILGVVGVLCGLLNFFIDRSMVNTVLVRPLDSRRDRLTLALSLGGRVALAVLAALPTAYVLTVQIATLRLRGLMGALPEGTITNLQATAELQHDTSGSAAAQVLLTAALVAVQLLPTIMAAFARPSLYARLLRAGESNRDIRVARTRDRVGRGTLPTRLLGSRDR